MPLALTEYTFIFAALHAGAHMFNVENFVISWENKDKLVSKLNNQPPSNYVNPIGTGSVSTRFTGRPKVNVVQKAIVTQSPFQTRWYIRFLKSNLAQAENVYRHSSS